jgi:hypothetical protein
MSKVAVRVLASAGACFAMMIADAEAAVPGLSTPNSGATAWVLTASALVLFMTLPGLTLFYGRLRGPIIAAHDIGTAYVQFADLARRDGATARPNQTRLDPSDQ